MQQPESTTDRVLFRALMGLVGVGFLAWAGVVWQSSVTIQTELHGVRVELAKVSSELGQIQREIRRLEDEIKARPPKWLTDRLERVERAVGIGG